MSCHLPCCADCHMTLDSLIDQNVVDDAKDRCIEYLHIILNKLEFYYKNQMIGFFEQTDLINTEITYQWIAYHLQYCSPNAELLYSLYHNTIDVIRSDSNIEHVLNQAILNLFEYGYIIVSNTMLFIGESVTHGTDRLYYGIILESKSGQVKTGYFDKDMQQVNIAKVYSRL